ncbi:hypothetical protein [Chryseobacterium proteolyticum]|uniref:hypothetical protein n=1 Tax=Chryseobacterium proteolyticum TaxID=118127 RepID=UPI0039834C60
MPLYENIPNFGFSPLGNSAESSLNNSQIAYVYVEKNQTIKITVKAWFVCCQAYIQAYYFDQEDKYVLQDVLKGGYRVSSTVDTPVDGLPITRKYKYIRDNGEYSINITRDPVFRENRTVGSLCIGSNDIMPPLLSNYNAITSSNIGRLFSFNPNIFYDTVEEVIEGKGKIVHYFNSNQDYWGNTLRGSSIISAPWTNSGWDNGKETKTVYKDNADITLKIIESNYVEDPARTFYLGAISRRKIYDPIATNGTGPYDDTWNDFANMDVVYYKNISRFTYLQSQKTTDYFNGNPIETKTEYFYTNPSHYQLNKQKITFPDASISETNYSYAHEKGNQLMINKNMVGIPIETNNTKTMGNNTKMLAKTEIIYPTVLPTTQTGNLVLPLSVNTYDVLNNNISTTEVTYNKYDSKGNIQQYTTKDGIPTSVVWGYNNTQPIAKVQGATYSQLVSLGLITAIVDASDQDAANPANEPALITALDNFRKNSGLSAYQISTYTYDPLIGVTSITPPSGIREVYIYDTANRLKEIRQDSKTGNLVKEFKYNYKN